MTKYDKENIYEDDECFDNLITDIKPIAIYLPQFHTFPENDEWWGKGFTEWENVKNGRPLFEGHYQPRTPHKDIGYYDLSQVETMKKQFDLAKKHGIYAFAFYYYWFSGKQLMKKPMQILLDHTELDMPFFLIWANENWTRTWDGKDSNILIEQKYEKTDAAEFIHDLKKYVDDPRYMRIDRKPVVAIYAAKEIPNIKRYIITWRKTASDCGIGDIYILVCASSANAGDLHISHLIDGEYEFPPRLKGYVSSEIKPNAGVAYDYVELVESERSFHPNNEKIDVFRGVMLNWDNSCRRKIGYNCWTNFSFKLFYLWLKADIVYSRKFLPADKRFIFLNAWNEWGEGTYLEPDEKYGYSAINAMSCAIYGLPFQKKAIPPGETLVVGCGVPADARTGWNQRLMSNIRVAVQAHVFYDELIPSIVQYTNNIPVPFDLYITTNCDEKAERIRNYTASNSKAITIEILVTNNKGRDVIPFLMQMRNHLKKYDYLCHLHTKQSKQSINLGNIWRDYLYDNLLGSQELVSEVLYLFECNPKLGIVMPENLDLLDGCIKWSRNKGMANLLMKRMNMKINLPKTEIVFPAGNMFWMRTSAVLNIFDRNVWESFVPEEQGQVDGTVMHAIERIWIYLIQANGYSYCITRNVLDNRPLVYYKKSAPDLHIISGREKSVKGIDPDEKGLQMLSNGAEAAFFNTRPEIGMMFAFEALCYAFIIYLYKSIAIFRHNRPEISDFNSPRNIAWVYGVRNCATILKKMIRIYIHRKRE